MSCARGVAYANRTSPPESLSIEAPIAPQKAATPLLTECDICGSDDLAEIRCKVICRNCRTILQSCADL